MADKAPVWRAIAERHGLRYTDIADAALWPHAGFVRTIDRDVVSSMNRARLAGVTYQEDTEDRFLRHRDAYREQKVLP